MTSLLLLFISLTIHDIQYTTDPSGNSPYVGQTVTVSGIVTAGSEDWIRTLDGGFFIQDAPGPWNGIFVWAPSYTVKRGDSVTVTGTVQEYYGKTEIQASNVVVHSSGHDLPPPYKVTASQIATGSSEAESFEGVYIIVDSVVVTDPDLGYGEWEIHDLSGYARVDDAGCYLYSPALNDSFIFIRGILDYSYGNFKLEPRTDGDILRTYTHSIDVFFNMDADTSLATIEKANFNVSIDSLYTYYIHSASYSLDICMYNISSLAFVDSLERAYDRGVKIRLIVDDDKLTNSYIQELINYGITVIGDNFGGNSGNETMHNKFILIDVRDSTDTRDDILITGSANATYYNMNFDANNVLVMRNRSIALAYLAEFEEMWGGPDDTPDPANSRFGQNKLDNTPHTFIIDGDTVEVYFSPSDNVLSHLTSTIGETQDEVDFAILIFTLDEVEDALESLWNSGGVIIGGVFDSTYWSSSNSKSLEMRGLGSDPWSPPAWVTPDSIHDGLLHHKYMIIDHNPAFGFPKVITGSTNWTYSGMNYNDENLIIIRSERIADLYYQEFSRRYFESTGRKHPGYYSVDEIQGTGAASPLLNLRVRTTGITTANFGNKGYIENLLNRGILVYSGSFTPACGESLIVTAIVNEYHGETELNAYNGKILSLGPAVYYPDTINLSIGDIGENVEGSLVMLSNVSFIESGIFSGNTSYHVTDGVDTLVVWIDDDTDIPGMDIPSEPINLVGVVGQYDANYELKPRTQMDIGGCVCGDINGDGEVNGSDFIYMGNYLFIGGPPPHNMECADVNNDGIVNSQDFIYLGNFLYLGGPPPNCD